jgi:hypothetical protein
MATRCQSVFGLLKKAGAIVDRAETFDSRAGPAIAWIVKRGAETLAAAIDRYIEGLKNPVAGTKAQLLV